MIWIFISSVFSCINVIKCNKNSKGYNTMSRKIEIKISYIKDKKIEKKECKKIIENKKEA